MYFGTKNYLKSNHYNTAKHLVGTSFESGKYGGGKLTTQN